MGSVKRIYVEKRKEFDISARNLLSNLKEFLHIENLEDVRIIIRYDIEGLSDKDYIDARTTIFSEPPADLVSDEELIISDDEYAFAIAYLPGQYDQRADSAAQCIQIMSRGNTPVVKAAQVIVLNGVLSAENIMAIKKYLINPIDSEEVELEKAETLTEESGVPQDVAVLTGFIAMSDENIDKLGQELGLAMSHDDLLHCQHYFSEEEKRDPTITEIKMLDTYWSDHCRHTTFLTEITRATIEKTELTKPVQDAYELYQETRKYVYGDRDKPECLMDIAVIGMKELRKKGLLDDLEISDEINACSIVVEADIDGKSEDWLVMFKNETHNHPTEIEPFGGAATCLGGAIRDPLSGRSYVYQAMRVTGCGDPRKSQEETLPGKLSQRKISTEAAHGYSSYGNQIGLTTGQVVEIYNEGYIAKRMEVGAVIAATPKENVLRAKPVVGDVIILVGGRTGRDGCGGATGSSKAHTESSIDTCGAEVQKGNPPTERKIQRLFRDPEVSKMIKKCNDFGAGGVSVAIGELADGLLIDLDTVPKKYDGLDGTELAISESQERMAVMVSKENASLFIAAAKKENLEATEVAIVTEESRVKLVWRGKEIVDISRDFIETNGVMQKTEIYVAAPDESANFFNDSKPVSIDQSNLKTAWLSCLADLNVCSQKGLVERFDSTIGGGTVNMPFGGKYQLTPTESMVAKLPVLGADTTTGTVMSYGFIPQLSSWSPFHGALYAVIESVARVVAVGGDYKKIRLTFQEYFEKLGTDSNKWGKPFGALLGAYYAQKMFGIAAIGGKDSMSGTFEDISVPPTLISFAVCPVNVNHTISPEFKKAGSTIVYIPLVRNEYEMPNFDVLRKQYAQLTELISESKINAMHTISTGGIAATLTKMAFGNNIGVEITNEEVGEYLFDNNVGSFICEIDSSYSVEEILREIEYSIIGETKENPVITLNGETIELKEALKSWKATLEPIFPTIADTNSGTPPSVSYKTKNESRPKVKIAKPVIFTPIFPGTNCEYDTGRAFERAGGIVDPMVFKNLTPQQIEESLDEMANRIDNAQIIMLPGGFSAGDEPDGSGKFIAAVFRNPKIKDAVHSLLKERDGLILGICNGFQALIKLGLVPYGEIREMTDECPTLTFNTIGRHMSQMINTKITSVLSPWFTKVNAGDIHTLAISHGEGRFVASDAVMEKLIKNGQIATQYVDMDGKPTYSIENNPNGSQLAIEAITSPDGRVLGKMGHSERIGSNVAKNIYGHKDQEIFEAGVEYFQ